MIYQPTRAANVRLLLSETLWLEPEHFEQAREMSQLQTNEQQQWQAYLNALALLGLETWLKEQLPDQPIQQIPNDDIDICYLNVDEFKLGLITTEHVLDQIVRVPKFAVEQPDSAAHFYVILEVLEDCEQVIGRGVLRYDELVSQTNRIASSPSDPFYRLPLSAFDSDLNHLTIYIQHSVPSAIPLPTASAQSVEAPLPIELSALRTRLSQWLQGVLDEGWQTIDALVNPEANLAWSSRHTSFSAQGGKLINFGMQLGDQSVVLLVTVTPENDGKIGINIQVLPTGGESVLPSQLKLTLLSRTNKLLQEVQSRDHDNLIQLKPFKGRPETCFSIEVSLNNIRVTEVFEL